MQYATANSLERVLEIRTALGSGTAFTIDYAGRQHVVTARHLLPLGDATPEVTLSNREFQRTLRLDLLQVEPSTADVAVAPLDQPLTVDLPLPPTMVGVRWSQELFFLGFPYGLATTFRGGEPNQRLAFIKGARLSAAAEIDGVRLLYLDGLNNPGFSGGPVVFNLDGDNQRAQVAGVISGYRLEHQPVYQGVEELKSVTAHANTGIIIATNIAHVVEAIDRAGTQPLD